MRSGLWLTMILATVAACACGSSEQPPAKAVPPATGKPVTGSTKLPDTIIIDTSEGRITLPHLAHAKQFQCNTCHSEVNPGKIAWDTATAHAYCRDCHKRTGKGPTACAQCHRK